MSQAYLSRLRSAVQSAKTNDELAIQKAELAGALARFGDVVAAKAIVAEIRSANPTFLPSLTACVLLAEGQVLHFQSLTTKAVRSFRAAEAVARSANRVDIASAALAWIAASEFLNGDMGTAARHAASSLQEAAANAFSARARAHLVLADCLSCAGLPQRASRQYTIARENASRMGDISMQSTVLYNRAAFEVAALSLSSIDENTNEEQVRNTRLTLESVENLDASIGLASLPSLVPLLRAQFSVATDLWHQGLALYEAHLALAEGQGQGRWMSKFHSERALCLARTGATDSAFAACESSLAQLEKCTDLDDLAIAHSRLSSSYQILGAQREAMEHRRASADYLGSFREMQCQMRSDVAEQVVHLTADLQ